MSKNPVHHRRTKHIELDIHFVREKVAIGELRVTHVPSARQLADVFTKGLPSALFFDFRDNLSVTTADVDTVGGVSGAPPTVDNSPPESSASPLNSMMRHDSNGSSSVMLALPHARDAVTTASALPSRTPGRSLRSLLCRLLV
jgi:hypothetical protein